MDRAMRNRYIIFWMSIFCLLASHHSVWAQSDVPPQDILSGTENDGDVVMIEDMGVPVVQRPKQLESLLFTFWEYSAIKDAQNARGFVRDTGENISDQDSQYQRAEEKIKPPPEEREIRLSGIAYQSSKKWTIWLNNQRVTPDSLPEEVMDLKVYKDYIEMKWHDDYTNRIMPIRLRAHQRFNIDTRIFLPG